MFECCIRLSGPGKYRKLTVIFTIFLCNAGADFKERTKRIRSANLITEILLVVTSGYASNVTKKFSLGKDHQHRNKKQ